MNVQDVLKAKKALQCRHINFFSPKLIYEFTWTQRETSKKVVIVKRRYKNLNNMQRDEKEKMGEK